jgi:hypothetical protein
MSERGLNNVTLSHPCDRGIPFVDVHGCTNALKDRMSERGLNIATLSHPCDRVIPFVLNIKKPAIKQAS